VDISSQTQRFRQQTRRHNRHLDKRSTLPHTFGRIGNCCNEKWKMNTANTTASSFLTTNDGIQIFFKDSGTGQPIVFHHGWPLSSDDEDNQRLFFLAQGYRVIAHDRGAKLLKNATLKVYKGLHGGATIHADFINLDSPLFL
jgi:hypothetical protein